MSLCSLIITKQAINDIGKNRYYKHELIYTKERIFVYSRMGGNILSSEQKVLMSYYDFLLTLRQFSSPIFITIDELHHRQSELDLAMEKIPLLNTQSKILPRGMPIDFGKIYFIL